MSLNQVIQMNDYFSYTPIVASYLIATQIYFIYLHEEYIIFSFFPILLLFFSFLNVMFSSFFTRTFLDEILHLYFIYFSYSFYYLGYMKVYTKH